LPLLESKRALIEPDHPHLSVARQCELLGLARSSWYYVPQEVPGYELELMRLIDEQYTAHALLRNPPDDGVAASRGTSYQSQARAESDEADGS